MAPSGVKTRSLISAIQRFAPFFTGLPIHVLILRTSSRAPCSFGAGVLRCWAKTPLLNTSAAQLASAQVVLVVIMFSSIAKCAMSVGRGAGPIWSDVQDSDRLSPARRKLEQR